MATNIEVIRTLTLKARTEGTQQATAQTKELAAASEEVARASISQEKATLGVERAYNRLQRTFDQAFRAQQELAKVQNTLAQAQAQGLVTQERSNELMQAAIKHFNGASAAMSQTTAASSAMAKGMGESAIATERLTRGLSEAGRAAASANDNLKSVAASSELLSARLTAGLSSVGKAALDSSRATETMGKSMSAAGKDAAAAASGLDANRAASDRLVKGLSDIGRSSLEASVMIEKMSAQGRASGSALISGAAGAEKFASGQKLARFEAINLSRQLQDIVVSLQAGQSPFTVILQQGSQIVDVVQTSGRGFKGFVTAAISGAAALITPLTAVVAGIGAIGAAAVVAAAQFGSGQQAIRQALTGVGAASGATLDSINAIAEAASSSFEVSIGEAREFASTLAATGKIGVEAIKDLTNISKNLSRAFGEDLGESAKRVAQAFSGDLVQAATQFNQRLGSLNSAQIENIRSLQNMGQEAKAQAILVEGLTRGLADQQKIITTSAGFWNALGNAIATAFSKLGEAASFATGIGFIESTEAEIKRLSNTLEELRREQAPGFLAEMFGGAANNAAKIAEIEAQLEKLRAKLVEAAEAAKNAKTNLDSVKADTAIRGAAPELFKKQELQETVENLRRIKQEIENGVLPLEKMKSTLDQINGALKNAEAAAQNFVTPLEKAHRDADLANKAAGALGPTAKAQIVFQQELNAELDKQTSMVDAISLAEKKRQTFLKQFNVEEGEARKARALSNEQAQQAANLELQLVNKTATEQARLRAQMQNRHQLEQAALAKSIDLNEEELAALNAQSDTTATLIGQRERMQQLTQATTSFVQALASGFASGKTAAESLQSALQGLGQQLISIGAQDIGKTIANSLQSIVGAIPGLGGITSIAAGIGVSLISRLFGGSDKQAEEAARKQQEELQKAKDAFAGMTKQIQDFNRAAAGLVKGELRTNLEELEAQRQPIAAAALRAQNFAAFNQIQATFAAGVARLVDEFQRALPALHEMLLAEGGLNGATAQSIQSVKTFREQVLGLKDSIEQASLAMSSSDILSQWDIFAQEAQIAALAMLEQNKSQSELITEYRRITTVAQQLGAVLIELGMSAEDAAAAISQKLTAAIAVLRGQFLDQLTRSINELVGAGWINEMLDLVAQVAQLRADATALGIQTAFIDQFYVLAAQKIVDENKLAGQSFQNLVSAFGLANLGLHEFNEALEDTAATIKRTVAEINAAIQSNEDRLALALHRSNSLSDQLFRFDLAAQREREAEIKAGGQALASLEAALAQERLNIINDFLAEQARLQQEAADRAAEEAERVRQEQIAAAQRAAEERARILAEAEEFIRAQTRRINEWIAQFLAGPQSVLPPSQQLAQAQSHFASELAAAAGGSRDALQDITATAQTLVDATRRYYGSSAAGQTIIQNMLAQLQGLPGLLSPEEFIVNGLTTPINTVSSTVTSTTTTQTNTLASLLSNLQLAVQSNDAQAIAAALLPMFDQLDTTMDQALSFAEFQAGLGGTFSTGTLRGIFNELDGNGNGLLEKNELIRIATQGTDSKVTPIAGIDNKMATNNDLMQQLVNLNGTGGAMYQVAIAQLQELQLVRSNTGVIASWQPGSSHAEGGLLKGPSHAQGGVHIGGNHWAEGGEYIMSRRTVGAFGVGTFDAMNFGRVGNDNNIFGAIRGLERSLLRGIKALMETQMDAADVIAEPMRENNKLTRTRRGEKKTA